MPTLDLPIAGGGVLKHSIPDVARDVLVLEASTQTLSGKTFDGNVAFLDNVKLLLGNGSDFGVYTDGTSLIVDVASTAELKITSGAWAFQQSTTFSSTAGNLLFAAASLNVFETDIRVNDNIIVRMGTSADVKMLLRSTTIAADAEVAGIIEGTSNHQGVTANSLVVSNITDDGDFLLLVSDGGNSLEMIKVTAATAELSLGWGALKIGLGSDLAAITRPATVTATSAAIITALIDLGLFTA